MDRACDAVEQTRMVGGVDGHQRRTPLAIHLRVDRQLRIARRRHLAGVMGQHILGLCDPIGFGQAADMRGELRLWPAEQLAQPRLLGGDPFGPPALFVAQAQHLFGGVVKIGEQLALPPVPRPGPTARMSTMVSRRSKRSRSGLCTVSQKSRIVLKSDRSRLNAVADISRCQRTSQATVSVSASLNPSRGQSRSATSAPRIEWSPPRPLAMSCSSTAT